MYHVGKELYTCDFCGIALKWDETDDQNGDMWGCERCGAEFCTKCFVDRHGRQAFDMMLRDHDLVLCPDCWKEEKNEVS